MTSKTCKNRAGTFSYLLFVNNGYKVGGKMKECRIGWMGVLIEGESAKQQANSLPI